MRISRRSAKKGQGLSQTDDFSRIDAFSFEAGKIHGIRWVGQSVFQPVLILSAQIGLLSVKEIGRFEAAVLDIFCQHFHKAHLMDFCDT